MSKMIIYSGFIRTWEQVKENHEQNILEEGDDIIFYTDKNPEYTKKNRFIELFPQIQDYSPAILINHAPETAILNALNQWNNRKTAFELITTFRDVCVITRADIKFSGKIDFSKVEEGKIYIPRGNDYRDGVNDQFAFGNYEAINQYCGLYNNWKKFFNEGLQFHPETYLKRQLRGLEIVRIPQTNQIIR